jgi:NhaP-type Na+/H+ or K+/H+ antiporter
MNTVLAIGLLVLTGYMAGAVVNKFGFPRIIGYILTGIVFSPNTSDLISQQVMVETNTLLSICLGFIAFEVGGELKWRRIRSHKKEIVSITVLASLIPFLLITIGFYFLGIQFAEQLPLGGREEILVFSILLAALASPTDPTATLAVIHQYNAEGDVKDSILGVAALDDGLGILLFSVAIAASSAILGQADGLVSPLVDSFIHIAAGVAIGVAAALIMDRFARWLNISSDGRWIVFIFSMITICYGGAAFFHADELLACMTMGLALSNTRNEHPTIFRIVERYTEELIILIFFVLSGMHLNIYSIPPALVPILLFVLLRSIGKYGGAFIGGALSGAPAKVRRHTGGGLIPQGGIVIGLALILNQYAELSAVSELLLTVVMGATVIHEIIGPLTTIRSLKKAGEVR